MNEVLLSRQSIIAAFDILIDIYPYSPSLVMWRAFEYAAYRRYSLPDPILDIGCGDGVFFELVHGSGRNAIGIDEDRFALKRAARHGIYRGMVCAPAARLPFRTNAFSSAFANCSLEHMENVSDVLRTIVSCLKPGAPMLCSVVTHFLEQWASLSHIGTLLDLPEGDMVLSQYKDYHRYPERLLTLPEWISELNQAGLEIEDYYPILPELTGRLFMLIDQLTHIQTDGGEVGDYIAAFLARYPSFPRMGREILHAVLGAEVDWTSSCGAVFFARKVR